MPDNSDLQNPSSPDLFSLLGKIIESTANDTQSGAAPVSAQPANTSFTGAPSASAESKSTGGDLLSSLLSNPEIISKLPQIISMMKPLMENMPSVPTSLNTQAPKANDTLPTSVIGHSKGGCDNRSALLYALKPYLKRERQEAIDYMVKLSRLGDILKNL